MAFAIGETIRKNYYGLQSTTGILISIRLFSGLTLFQAACGQNVNPNNEDWVRRKYNTVRDFGLPTLLKGRDLQKKGKDINSLGPDYAAHGGGYPIMINSVGPIGAIVVSGLSQETDHALIVESLRKFVGPEEFPSN
ncbi:hypothetical protein CBS101457_002707 [Exobasidium rhododendri]|nr:hypothetical protein CBS101457_002707 [Exobasidium rhododendri]